MQTHTTTIHECPTENFILFEEILQDDFNHLFNLTYYPQTITFEFFNELLQSLKTTQDLMDVHENSSRFRIFLKCLLNVEKWNVYIILKWMVYVHSIMPMLHIAKLFELIEQILNKLNLPCVKGKHFGFYENYLMTNLVKPYIQYISKLCSIKSKLLQQSTKIKIEENKQNQFQYDSKTSCLQETINAINFLGFKQEQDSSSDHLELLFQSFNLLNFALQEFPHIILETKGYLISCYPYCANFATFIASDLKELFHILIRQHSIAGKHSFISLKEIQEFEIKVNLFYDNTINCSKNKPYSLMNIQPQIKQDINKQVEKSVLTDHTAKQNILLLPLSKNQISQNKVTNRKRTASYNPQSFKIIVHCTASCKDDQNYEVQQKANEQQINLGSPIKPRLTKKITVEDEIYFQQLQICNQIF